VFLQSLQKNKLSYNTNRWKILRLFVKYSKNQKFRYLLRRKDLHEPTDNPFIIQVIIKLSQTPKLKDELLHKYCCLWPISQVKGDLETPSNFNKTMEWVPFYTAARTAYDTIRGHDIESEQILDAISDFIPWRVGKLGKVGKKAFKELRHLIKKEAQKKSKKYLLSVPKHHAKKKLPMRIKDEYVGLMKNKVALNTLRMLRHKTAGSELLSHNAYALFNDLVRLSKVAAQRLQFYIANVALKNARKWSIRLWDRKIWQHLQHCHQRKKIPFCLLRKLQRNLRWLKRKLKRDSDDIPEIVERMLKEQEQHHAKSKDIDREREIQNKLDILLRIKILERVAP
jgi:hypothetical protein